MYRTGLVPRPRPLRRVPSLPLFSLAPLFRGAVLGGGIARRYSAIATLLNDLIPNPTERTAAPAEAKSAAYAGLEYRARLHEHETAGDC